MENGVKAAGEASREGRYAVVENQTNTGLVPSH